MDEGVRKTEPRPCRLIIRSGAMKTLGNPRDREEILARLQRVRPGSSRRWGKTSAHQMICYLTDGFRLYLGLMNVAAPGFPYPNKLLRWRACGSRSVGQRDSLRSGNSISRSVGLSPSNSRVASPC